MNETLKYKIDEETKQLLLEYNKISTKEEMEEIRDQYLAKAVELGNKKSYHPRVMDVYKEFERAYNVSCWSFCNQLINGY